MVRWIDLVDSHCNNSQVGKARLRFNSSSAAASKTAGVCVPFVPARLFIVVSPSCSVILALPISPSAGVAVPLISPCSSLFLAALAAAPVNNLLCFAAPFLCDPPVPPVEVVLAEMLIESVTPIAKSLSADKICLSVRVLRFELFVKDGFLNGFGVFKKLFDSKEEPPGAGVEVDDLEVVGQRKRELILLTHLSFNLINHSHFCQ